MDDTERGESIVEATLCYFLRPGLPNEDISSSDEWDELNLNLDWIFRGVMLNSLILLVLIACIKIIVNYYMNIKKLLNFNTENIKTNISWIIGCEIELRLKRQHFLNALLFKVRSEIVSQILHKTRIVFDKTNISIKIFSQSKSFIMADTAHKK